MRKKGFQNTRPPAFFEKTQKNAALAAEAAAHHRTRGYIGYLWSLFRRGTPYALIHRLSAVFSPAFFTVRLIRIFFRVLLFIEKSAHLLLLAALLLLLAPLFLLVFLAFSYAARHARRRANRRFGTLFRGRRVIAFFPSQNTPFAEALYRDLSKNYTVLIVSDFAENAPSSARLHPIAAALPIGENCLYLREHYYFYLRRTLLREAAFFAAIY